MSKRTMKLVKGKKRIMPEVEEQVVLTPAEQAEAARFRALTAGKAQHQAAVTRLIAKLQDSEEISNVA